MGTGYCLEEDEDVTDEKLSLSERDCVEISVGIGAAGVVEAAVLVSVFPVVWLLLEVDSTVEIEGSGSTFVEAEDVTDEECSLSE